MKPRTYRNNNKSETIPTSSVSKPVVVRMKLKFSPPKYTGGKFGTVTTYDCGFKAIGNWSDRLKQHKDFCETTIGKYILELEDKTTK